MKEGKKLRLSFRGYETTVIMSQELGKHMLVCCCWNRGALLRLRFGNMKDFVGWAGGLALIQGLIAREAGSELQLWDRERNLVTYSREDRSSKQTQARGCWANHSATLSALNPPLTRRGWDEVLAPTWPNRRGGLNIPHRNEEGQVHIGARSCTEIQWLQNAGIWQQPPLFGRLFFFKQSRLCVVLLQPIKLLNSISSSERMHRGQAWDVQKKQSNSNLHASELNTVAVTW